MEIRNFRDCNFNVYRSNRSNPVQLIIFHGICEHSLRYVPFIKHLNKIGFDCTLIDHPGHGQQALEDISGKNVFDFYNSLEDDLNLSIENTKTIISEEKAAAFQKNFTRKNKTLNLNKIIEFQKDFYSFLFKEKIYNHSQPVMLMGQSMGGLIASSLGNEFKDLSGIILLSPAFEALPKPVNSESAADKFRHRVESMIITKSDESFYRKSLFSTVILNPLIGINPVNDCSWAAPYISDIAEINEIFSKDPLIGRGIALKFLQSIQQEMKIQREMKSDYHCPVFLQFGSDDKIVCAEGSRNFIFNRLKNNRHFHKQLSRFEPHEIHNSKRRSYLLSDLEEWTKKLF